jgi:hypothetical protein
MKKLFIIGGVTFSLIASVSLGYFFMHRNTKDDLISKINNLQTDIVVAKDKLKKEKKILESMTGDLSNSFPLAMGVQDQMRKGSDIVKRTDFMFSNPYDLDPELILKNILNGMAINDERKNINLLIEKWQKETDILSINKIDINESQKILQEAKTIQIYIENLNKIVNNLTPENSGLSQFQINIYVAELPSVNEINQVITSISNVIENYISSNSQIILGQTSTTTPGNVIAEQIIIEETQTQIAILQMQLAQAEQQLQELYPAPSPAPIVTETIPPLNTIIENQDINYLTYPSIYNPRTINRDDFQGIIIQPGEPRLIQGIDQY